MRKALLAATVAIATMTSAVTAADISLGIDGYLDFGSQKYTTKPTGGEETSIKMTQPISDEVAGPNEMFTMLRVGIRTSDILEISPYFGIGFANSKTVIDNGKKEQEITSKQTLLGAGVGTYFHILNKDWFELSTGPRLGWVMATEPKETDETDEDFKATEYDTFKSHTLGVDVPLNLDFLIGDAFGIRLSTELLEFSVNNTTIKYKGSETERKLTTTDIDAFGFKDAPLSVGVFFRF